MALKDELDQKVKQIFKEQWTTRSGTKVPATEDVKLANDAVELEATVLYADLADSTKLVETHKKHFAAEIYKSYLWCSAKVILAHDGVITSFDGDRIMAVYIGKSKCTNAVKTALKINYAVKKIINPALKAQYPDTTFEVQQVVGVDTSSLWAVRGGVRGSNDLLWIGNAANIAAKLNSLSPDYPSWVTKAVYDVMSKDVKVSSDGRNMWEARTWNAHNNMSVYRSNWTWTI